MSKESKRSLKTLNPKSVLIGLNLEAGSAIAFASTDVITADDTITIVAHGLVTGNRVQVATAGTLPTGLAATTDYWIIKISDDLISFATTLANSAAGTVVSLTGAGAGASTVTRTEVIAGQAALLPYTVEAQATGNYRITFDPANPWLIADYNVVATAITADVQCRVKAKALTYVDIEVKENDDAPVAIDGLFELIILGSQASYRWS
ncbi:MAG: hypothetical protein KAI17_22955 [Thiotrichaceae bacterium]|nr:hypothetical protein [Thiotrichaceae bacterium]